MWRIAFNTSRKSTSIGRPAFDARGRKGSIRAHSSSVKSLGYRLVFFSIVAIRPRVAGVHIPGLNTGRKPHSTTFQTDSEDFHIETLSLGLCEELLLALVQRLDLVVDVLNALDERANSIARDSCCVRHACSSFQEVIR